MMPVRSHRMVRVFAALLALSTTALTGAGEAAAADQPSDPPVSITVINGEDAVPGDAPWQVALIAASALNDYDGQFCGGSLISDEWVVTAAHCVTDHEGAGISPDLLAIMAGGQVLSEAGHLGTQRGVDLIQVHADYDPLTYMNDIALMHLDSPVPLEPGLIEAISLPTDAAASLPVSWPASGTDALITGWGKTSAGTYPADLQKALVDVIGDPVTTTCGRYGAYYEHDTMLCAGLQVIDGDQTYAIDTCQGDSGGPLAVQVSGEWVLAGITSWGSGCAEPDYPGVYTRVTTYVDWIALNARPTITIVTAGDGFVFPEWSAAVPDAITAFRMQVFDSDGSLAATEMCFSGYCSSGPVHVLAGEEYTVVVTATVDPDPGTGSVFGRPSAESLPVTASATWVHADSTPADVAAQGIDGGLWVTWTNPDADILRFYLRCESGLMGGGTSAAVAAEQMSCGIQDDTFPADGTSLITATDAVMSEAGWSPWSTPTAPVNDAPGVVEPPYLGYVTPGNGSLSLAWLSTSATGPDFQIEQSSDGGQTWVASNVEGLGTYDDLDGVFVATVTGLTNGTPYLLRVRYINTAIAGKRVYGLWAVTDSPTAPVAPASPDTPSQPPVAPDVEPPAVTSAPDAPTPPAQVPAGLPPVQFDNPSAVTAAMLAALTAEQVATIPPSVLSLLPPAAFRGLTPAQAGAMTVQQVRAIRPAAAAFLRPRTLAALRAEQVAALRPASVARLSRAQLRSLRASSLTARQLAALSPAQLRALRG